MASGYPPPVGDPSKPSTQAPAGAAGYPEISAAHNHAVWAPPGGQPGGASTSPSPSPAPAGYPEASAGAPDGGYWRKNDYAVSAAPPPAAAPRPVSDTVLEMGPAGTGQEEFMSFTNKDVRRGFVRKVLFLVAIQLLITTAISWVFYEVTPIRNYLHDNLWVFYVALILALVLIVAMACVPKLRRKVPLNYILLFSFTLLFSVVVGVATSTYDQDAIAIAAAVTAATVVGAWLVAAFTPLDITKAGGFLLACLVGLICASLLGIFLSNVWYHFAIAVAAALLFTAYLVYDLQLIMGGRTYEISPDEYVFAAINVYLDIINIFLSVLQIVSFAQS